MAPALASVLLALGGLTVILIIDLVSFAIAFITLLFFIFISCAITFLVGDTFLSLSDSLWFWIIISFISYIPVTILGTNLAVIIDDHVSEDIRKSIVSAELQSYHSMAGM